jgi:deoxycytidylate deaminase
VEVKVTDVFNVLKNYIVPLTTLLKSPIYDRYVSYIAYGNQLREKFHDAILAVTTIRRVIQKRLKYQKAGEEFSNTVYLLHQFKRKEEIDLLRTVYGKLFFQISIYSRRGARVDHLSRNFASSDNVAGANKYRQFAEQLTKDDEEEVEASHGQRVAKIFHDADFIANIDARDGIEDQIHRFCELLFGSNSISPTHTEYGLFLAKAAALRSLDLSRQVGAAIFATNGEVVALGSNEVPKAKGGTYWAKEAFDDRDYLRRYDSNAKRKKELLGELVSIISPTSDLDDLLKDKRIKDSQFMDALEYGRIVHAEMCALTDAARLGHSVRDGILYCTTFPCHMCAKHIVASGIGKVVFLEPYPKSLASDLHSDSIQIESGERGRYHDFPSVQFEHFYGVTPRRYREIFERSDRRKDDGSFKEYVEDPPSPIINVKYPLYHQLEGYVIKLSMEELKALASDLEVADA